MITPGKNYLKKTKELGEKIKEGEIDIEIEDSCLEGVCYFCLMPIKGQVFKLVERNENGISKYYCDEGCIELMRDTAFPYIPPYTIKKKYH